MTFDIKPYTIIKAETREADSGKFAALGGVWDYKNSAWLVPCENMGKYEEVMNGVRIFLDAAGSSHIMVTGDTFSIKDHLKPLGAVFVKEVKGWLLPAATRPAVQRLIDGFILDYKTPRGENIPNTPELKL
jgi:hypothetical protein